jgi:hypothetical protein
MDEIISYIIIIYFWGRPKLYVRGRQIFKYESAYTSLLWYEINTLHLNKFIYSYIFSHIFQNFTLGVSAIFFKKIINN